MITTCIGDILSQNVEAIVNAANGIGVMGAGVARAIRDAAGVQVQAEAMSACANLGTPVPAGRCYATGPGKLADKGIKRIYHAVVMPLPGSATSLGAVAKSWMACLWKAISDGMKSIAVTGLGTGIGKLEIKDVAMVMYAISFMFQNNIDIVIADKNEDFIRFVRINKKFVERIRQSKAELEAS